MKKFILALFVIMLSMLSVGCENAREDNGVVTPAPVRYLVRIDIDCEENLLFNKYDVTVEIDHDEVGVLDHGAQRTIEVMLEEGAYTLSFEKEGDRSVDGEVEITIDRDMYYSFDIKCETKQIKANLVEAVDLAKVNEPSETNYTVAYVMECLKNVPSINAIEVDDSKHDEFAELDSCAGCIFFSSDFVNQENVHGDTVLEKGTTGGGSIDVFSNREDALARNAYLSKFDGTILQTGTHVVYDTLVIRLSIELDEEAHDELYNSIVNTLTSGAIQPPSEYNPTWYAEGFNGDKTIPTPNPSSTELPIVTSTPTPIPTPSPTATAKPEEESVYYSTNTRETVDDGDSGVYAYRSRGGSYDIYWIIDFDEGYVYYFTEGNGNDVCDRLKIESGDLNTAVKITYHDNGDEWSYKLHFKYVDNPEHLIMNDNNGFAYDYYTTSLNKALSLKDSKRIKDY